MPTSKEINEAMDELRNAMQENITINIQEDKLRIQRIASQKRLLLAKQTIWDLKLN